MAIRVLRSSATRQNTNLVERKRADDEDNEAWLRRIVDEKRVDTVEGSSVLLLVGGTDPLSFRLRVAQSHARHDLSPSAWSHAAFVERWTTPLSDIPLLEVSLNPPLGFGAFGFAPTRNGLQRGRMSAYFDARHFPNIALLSVQMPAKELADSLESIGHQRSVFDVPQLILRWLTYGWGVGVPASPLADGFGIPCAAVLEAAFAANEFDLTPGLESRSSCPEAIWQAARYWYGYHQRTAEGRSMKGAYSAMHHLIPERDDIDERAPAAPKASPPKPRAGKRASKPKPR